MTKGTKFAAALTALMCFIFVTTVGGYGEITLGNETYWLVHYDELQSNQDYIGVFHPDYTCTDTALETSKVLTSGGHQK